MRLFATIAGMLLASALAITTAEAGDLMSIPTSGNDSLPIADAGFDWNGFYAGVYGAGGSAGTAGAPFGLGVDAGVNARFDFVLVGAEVAVVGNLSGDEALYLQGLGKVGITLTDDLVAYGVSGLGTSFSAAGGSDVLVGGGLELAVADDVSLNARYMHGIPLGGAASKDQVTIGANFHF